MVRAREVIRRLGGIEATNSFTRIYLAVFGQWDWDDCPAVPPELVLLPDWFPFTLYKISSWSRTIVVPLGIIWASKPFCPVPKHAQISELRTGFVPERQTPRTLREAFWYVFFTAIDNVLKSIEAAKLLPFRQRALEASEKWIHERLVKSDGLGAIFPPIINTIMAFRCLGYASDDPRLNAQERELEKLEIEDEDTLRVQPCFSPVWDTAIASPALVASGLAPDDSVLRRAARWLLDREVTQAGDWTRRAPEAPVGGWYFEYANECYPDTDDTAEVLTSLSYVRFPAEEEDRARREAIERGPPVAARHAERRRRLGRLRQGMRQQGLDLHPVRRPQRDDRSELRGHHRARARGPLQPGRPSRPSGDAPRRRVPPVQAGRGRHLVRPVGQQLHLRNLARAARAHARRRRSLRAALPAGRPVAARDAEPRRRMGRAAALLRGPVGQGGRSEHPVADGLGPDGALRLSRTRPPTACAGASTTSCATQQYDGSWRDEHWTATGFPKVFYLRYHLYATYFPLWALSLYRRSAVASAVGARSEVAAAAAVAVPPVKKQVE